MRSTSSHFQTTIPITSLAAFDVAVLSENSLRMTLLKLGRDSGMTASSRLARFLASTGDMVELSGHANNARF